VKLRADPPRLEQARTNLVEDARGPVDRRHPAHKEQARSWPTCRSVWPLTIQDLAKDGRERCRQPRTRSRLAGVASSRKKRGRIGRGGRELRLVPEENVHLVRTPGATRSALHERELGRARAHLAIEVYRNRALPPLEPIATAEEWQTRLPKEVAAYVQFLADKQIVTIKDYMLPALAARIGTFAPAAERDFFAQVEYREPLLLRSHGNHWFDLGADGARAHASPIRKGTAPLQHLGQRAPREWPRPWRR
jgi:hypothetical protein